jgi:hypothetical protein
MQAYKNLFTEATRLASQGVEYAKQFVDFMSPKLKHKKGRQRVGDLKKRDIRSNKQRQRINDAITAYKQGKAKAQKERKQVESLVSSGYADSADSAKDLLSLFAVMTTDRMKQKFGFSCEQIADLNEYSEELGIDEVKKVAEWVMSDKEDSTPSYLKEYLQEDDEYKLADLVLNILENEDISFDDLQMAFSEEPTTKWRDALESGDFNISDYLEEYWR